MITKITLDTESTVLEHIHDTLIQACIDIDSPFLADLLDQVSERIDELGDVDSIHS